MKPAVPLSRYVVFFALAIGLAAADLAAKSRVFADLTLREGQTRWFWDGVFGFRLSLNEGALFGFGQGLSALFAALSVGAAVAVLIWLFGAPAAQDWFITIALAFIMAGILGNLYDRLGLHGLCWPSGVPGRQPGSHIYAVRDFIHVVLHGWAWPTFNLADAALDCGGIADRPCLFRQEKRNRRNLDGRPAGIVHAALNAWRRTTTFGATLPSQPAARAVIWNRLLICQ